MLSAYPPPVYTCLFFPPLDSLSPLLTGHKSSRKMKLRQRSYIEAFPDSLSNFSVFLPNSPPPPRVLPLQLPHLSFVFKPALFPLVHVFSFISFGSIPLFFFNSSPEVALICCIHSIPASLSACRLIDCFNFRLRSHFLRRARNSW